MIRRRRGIAFALAAVAMLALVAGAIWLSLRSKPAADEADDGVAERPLVPLPAIPASPYANTRPGIEYVGSHRCTACHEDETASFRQTPHARSLSLANDMTPRPDGEVIAEKSGYAYRIATLDGRMTQTEFVRLKDGSLLPGLTAEVTMAIGSGTFGQSYATTRDGYSVQSPVAWYSTHEHWNMSVGYDGPDQPSFRRTLNADCFFCHAGRIQVHDENLYRFDLVEATIGCERCHGPGALHVAKWESLGGQSPAEDFDDTIVNPARLDRDLGEAVCQQCHLQGKTQISVRGRTQWDYRPGLPLDAFQLDYTQVDSTGMTIVGHVEQMRASSCFQKSDSLTCTTCHDPHHRDDPATRPARIRSVCQSCHGDASCRAPEESRRMKNDDCVKCHMPEAPIEQAHVSFTHHRIGRHSETVAKSEDGRERIRIAPLLGDPPGPADEARMRGLASLRMAFSAKSAEQGLALLKEGRTLLQRAWDDGAGDAAVAVGLAESSADLQLRNAALKWARRALAMKPADTDDRIAAHRLIAELELERGHFEDALAEYDVLQTLRNDARDWHLRGVCEARLGRNEAAIRSLQKSLELSPRQPSVHETLAAVFSALGDGGREREHRQRAEQMESLEVPAPRSSP